jgi:hypothetical protein
MAGVASYVARHLMATLTRLICAIRGHEHYRHFEKNRVYLQCIGCGHESAGWTVDARRPVLRFHARRPSTSRHGLMQKTA